MEHFKGKDYFYVENFSYNRVILNNNDENMRVVKYFVLTWINFEIETEN